MELDRKTREIVGELGLESVKASISENDMDKLWDLIENPYKNAIASIVREYTSNSFDAHTDAKVKDAVIIKYGRDNTGWYISFIDVGTGMSPDLMKNIFLKVFASTKETSNVMVGCFGMGSKAGLSYNDFFLINTHVNGTTYKYMYRKGETRPTLDTMEIVKEKRRNGTEFRVPVNNDEDFLKFIRAGRSQLYYFDNVVFDYAEIINHLPENGGRYDSGLNKDNVKSILDVNYKLKKYDNFLVRFNKVTNYMFTVDDSEVYKELHLANGPVYYPIDFVNIESDYLTILKPLNIALKFDIGELDVIQTREDIKYTTKSILAIKDKAKKAYEEIMSMYGKTLHTSCFELGNYIELFNKPSSLILGKGDYTYEIELSSFPAKVVTYKPFEKIHTGVNPFFVDYLGNSVGKQSGNLSILEEPLVRYSTGKDITYDYNMKYNLLEEKGASVEPLILISSTDKISNKINKQIGFKDYKLSNGTKLKCLVDKRKKRNLDYFKKALHLKRIPKQHWREFINVFIKIEQELIDKSIKEKRIIDYDKIKLNTKWYSEFAKKHRKTSATRDMTKVSYTTRESSYNSNIKWENYNITIRELVNSNYLTIMTTKDDKDDLLWFDKINIGFSEKYKTARYIATSPTIYKKIDETEGKNDNFFTYKEFMENKDNIKFKFLKELHLAYLLNNKYKNILTYHTLGLNEKYLKGLSPKVAGYYDDVKSVIGLAGNTFSNSTIRDMYDLYFKDEYEEIEEYFNLAQHELIEKLDIISKFYYYFVPFLSDFTSGYYSTNSNTLDKLSLFLSFYKETDTKILLNNELSKVMTAEEYKMHKEDVTRERTFVEKLQIHLYEIKNNLNITKYKT
jgi:hypothetical protein